MFAFAIWLLGTLRMVRSMRADARRPQADVIDRAGDVPELDEVADPHGLVEDDGQPADDVLERLLRGQRHRDAADAEAGESRGRIEADVVQ